MTVRVLRAGAYMTVQDSGRRGWQRDGVPVSGAMDDVAFRIANMLVGNDEGAAALEATLRGPTLQFEHGAHVAITGADMDARVDGRRIAPWWSAYVAAGTTLTLDTARAGCRSYIAVAGGIAAPVMLGSRSTYARAGIGCVVRRGDVLNRCEHQSSDARHPARGVDVHHLELNRASVRLIPGPLLAQLDHAPRQVLLGQPFTLSPGSDRMGLRFTGPPVAHGGASDQLSAPVAMGTVQLPPGGAPIILMADRQTTGGYPRLGEIASVDLPILAQLRPGESIGFEQVTLEDAERLHLVREREIAALGRALRMQC